MPGVSVRYRALTGGRIGLATDKQIAAMRQHAIAHVTAVIKAVRVYPPKPAHSRYVRTEHLFRSWTLPPVVTTPASGLRVTAVNTAAYADRVQGPGQLWFHQVAGWKRLDQFARRDVFQAGIRTIMGGFKVGRV